MSESKPSELFTEEDASELAEKVYQKVAEKIKGQLVDSFYDNVSLYLDGHYANAKERIDGKLIDEITERFAKDPASHKFRDLRQKLFDENREVVTALLTDAVLEHGIENVIMQRTSKDYYFEWRWKDGIAQFIANNWQLFENDERIGSTLARIHGQQQQQIKYLKEQLEEYDDES